MNQKQADALVFFGASGDLAYKKIFPAFQAMIRAGRLDIPVIGVAKSGWTRDQLVARAKDSVTEHAARKIVARNRSSNRTLDFGPIQKRRVVT